MESISDYTIYCTPEQTRKALALGAPIELESEYYHPTENDFMLDNPIPCKYFTTGYHYAKCPTAEQMIGWLEEQMGITTFHINHYSACKNEGYGYLIISKESVLECDAENEGMYLYPSRREAALAAIDAALEYLSNNKK